MAKKFFMDPQRCIGCRSCMAACQECDTHRGVSMIFIDTLDTFWSPQTSPTVCMHCVNPPCANVCPVDAIKPDAEPGSEKWLSVNAEFAKTWPNITVKKEPPADAKEWDGVADKYKKFFSPEPGEGD